MLKLIDQLFEVEALCPTGPSGDEMRTSLRQSRSRPLVQQIERWALGTQTLPGSGLRGAIEYMGKLCKGLIVFLDDPRVPLHNNSSERSLRSPVIGRVNYYGSRSRRGTEAAAVHYSLVESAKRAHVDPSAYLDHAAHCALRGEVIPLPHELAARV